MKANGNPTDYGIFNAMGIEQLEQFFPIGEQFQRKVGGVVRWQENAPVQGG